MAANPEMSRMSKLLLGASAALFFLAPVVRRFGRWYDTVLNPTGPASELVDQYHATGINEWDVIFICMIIAAFACVVCAILLWRRHRPFKHQKLFPE